MSEHTALIEDAMEGKRIKTAAVSALDAILSASESNGGSFTCWEAEAIADLFDVVGLVDDKHSFLEQHSDGDDDEEDMHVGYRYRELMFWDDGVDVDSTNVLIAAEHRRARGEGSIHGPFDTGHGAQWQANEWYRNGTFDPDGCEVTFKVVSR